MPDQRPCLRVAPLGSCAITDEAWDGFIAESCNGTVFHTRRFLQYHEPERFVDGSLCFFEGERLVGVFPAAALVRDGSRVLVSHPGSSYGGIVLRAHSGWALARALVMELCAYARQSDFQRLEMRLPEKIWNAAPCDELDFALIKAGFRRDHEELSTCYTLADLPAADDAAVLSRFAARLGTRRRPG